MSDNYDREYEVCITSDITDDEYEKIRDALAELRGWDEAWASQDSPSGATICSCRSDYYISQSLIASTVVDAIGRFVEGRIREVVYTPEDDYTDIEPHHLTVKSAKTERAERMRDGL